MFATAIGDPRWIANLLSLLCVAAGWFVWEKTASANKSAIPTILLGAALVGGIGFIGGFFGPMIFTPRSNQGPMLGIFITGPLGFLVGGVIGFIYWITRRQVQSDTEVVNSNIAVQNVQKIQLKNEFALEKNTASLAALFIMASMLIYALVDTVFINLYEIVGYPDNKSLLIVLSAMPICLLGFIIHSLYDSVFCTRTRNNRANDIVRNIVSHSCPSTPSKNRHNNSLKTNADL